MFPSRTSWPYRRDYCPQAASSHVPPIPPLLKFAVLPEKPNCLAPFLLQSFQQQARLAKTDYLNGLIQMKFIGLEETREQAHNHPSWHVQWWSIAWSREGRQTAVGKAMSSAGTAGARKEHSSMAWVSRWISKRALLSFRAIQRNRWIS